MCKSATKYTTKYACFWSSLCELSFFSRFPCTFPPGFHDVSLVCHSSFEGSSCGITKSLIVQFSGGEDIVCVDIIRVSRTKCRLRTCAFLFRRNLAKDGKRIEGLIIRTPSITSADSWDLTR